MAYEKIVYVPRNWKVSYVDTAGNKHNDVELRVNSGYRITTNDAVHYVTIGGIRTEENKNYIVAKVIMVPGTMNVMKKAEDVKIDVDTVIDIAEVSSTYHKLFRSNREKASESENVFTFAFDTEKYSTKYRISINAGEFVSLAVKDIKDPNKKSRSFYGHIIDVDNNAGIIKFSRYITNKGVRDVFIQNIPLTSLLGVYRYELVLLDINTTEDKTESETTTEPAVEE